MNTLKLKIILSAIFCFGFFSANCFAQQGQTTINQDKNITHLLNLKKELNKDEDTSDRYKIQIFSGNRAGANKALVDFRKLYRDWRSIDMFEPPNFKVWIGNFRTRLEADRALKRIKKNFPSAFIFKPKKKKG